MAELQKQSQHAERSCWLRSVKDGPFQGGLIPEKDRKSHLIRIRINLRSERDPFLFSSKNTASHGKSASFISKTVDEKTEPQCSKSNTNEPVEDKKEAGRERAEDEARREDEVRRAARLADGESRSEELPSATKALPTSKAIPHPNLLIKN